MLPEHNTFFYNIVILLESSLQPNILITFSNFQFQTNELVADHLKTSILRQFVLDNKPNPFLSLTSLTASFLIDKQDLYVRRERSSVVKQSAWDHRSNRPSLLQLSTSLILGEGNILYYKVGDMKACLFSLGTTNIMKHSRISYFSGFVECALEEKMESFWPKKLSHWRNQNSTRDSQ